MNRLLYGNELVRQLLGNILGVVVVLRDFTHTLPCEVVSDILKPPQERQPYLRCKCALLVSRAAAHPDDVLQ